MLTLLLYPLLLLGHMLLIEQLLRFSFDLELALPLDEGKTGQEGTPGKVLGVLALFTRSI